MNFNWKLIGKIALGIAVVGVSGTTAVLIYRHVKKNRDDKKKAEELPDDKTKENIEQVKDQFISDQDG